MTDEPLLPAEAVLLVEPKTSAAGKCIQAALLTLLGKNHVAIEEEGRFFKQRFLRILQGAGEPLPRHLAIIKNSLDVYAVDGRIKSNQVCRALKKSFGMDFRRYVDDVLGPALISRGLIRREDRRFLGLLPYVHYERTANGEAMAGRLIRLLDEAGGLRKLIRTDPDRAVRLAQAAGVLLLLSPAAKAQIPKLKALLADRGGDVSSVYFFDRISDEPDWQLGVEVGNFSFAADALSLFDGIGGVGDFTGGDGGDGGGDGGGGD